MQRPAGGAPARPADGQPRRRRGGAAGIAQGAGAARLSGAGAAAVGAQPAVRAAVGRAQRPARRAALVPQQDQGPRRRRRAGRASTTHGDTIRLDLADCFVDAIEVGRAAQRGHRRRSIRSGCERSPPCSPAIFSRAWRSTAARPSTAGSPPSGAGSAPAMRPCSSISSSSVPDDEVFGASGASGCSSRRSIGACTRLLLDALGAGTAGSARARSIWRRRPGCSRPRASMGAASRAWRSARAQARRLAGCAGRRRRRQPLGQRPRHDVATASRRASIAVMPFVDRVGRGRRPRRAGRRARPRRDHAAGQAAQPVRHRAGHRVRARRAAHRPGRGRPDAERRLRRQRLAAAARPARSPWRSSLSETRTARIVWAEVFDHKLDDAFLVLDEIGDRIVASIASEIETIERNRAILRPPSSLDAWEAYHRGLWHMYRFNRGRQRAGAAFLRDRGAPRSDLRARLCRPVVHALPERLPGLGRPRRRRSSARSRPPGRA